MLAESCVLLFRPVFDIVSFFVVLDFFQFFTVFLLLTVVLSCHALVCFSMPPLSLKYLCKIWRKI